jgi:hypothetical protein
MTANIHEGESKSFRTGRLVRELQMVQLSATKCSCIAILWVSLVSIAPINFCVASQRMFIVVISFSTQSGNFWIHPRICTSTLAETVKNATNCLIFLSTHSADNSRKRQIYRQLMRICLYSYSSNLVTIVKTKPAIKARRTANYKRMYK